MSYKYVCFDIGNVLCPIDHKLDNFINHHNDLGDSNSKLKYNVKDYQIQQDLGHKDINYILTNSLYNIHTDDPNTMISKWNSIIEFDLDMINLIKELISKGIKIALLSNIGTDHKLIVDEYLKYNNLELITHYSCDVGSRKPQMLYFQSFLMQYPEFKNCLFIDDIQHNLDGAKKIGFDVLRFNLLNDCKLKSISNIRNIIYNTNTVIAEAQGLISYNINYNKLNTSNDILYNELTDFGICKFICFNTEDTNNVFELISKSNFIQNKMFDMILDNRLLKNVFITKTNTTEIYIDQNKVLITNVKFECDKFKIERIYQ